MGAEGGVVYIPLRKPSYPRQARVVELLNPFYQFLSVNGLSNVGEDANADWLKNNPSFAYGDKYIWGYYGTDRVDDYDLTQLPEICGPDPEDPIYDLTFEELDLDCRTNPLPIDGEYWQHPLYKLWYQHFHWRSNEKVLEVFGSLATMKIRDWADELSKLLYLDRCASEETWT